LALLYTTLFDAGQRDDIARYVNRDLLIEDWPRIRRLTSRELIGIWEERLPVLASARPGPAWTSPSAARPGWQ